MRKRPVFLILAAVFLFAGLHAEAADYVNQKLLVSPSDISKNSGNWIVLDCRDKVATVDKKTGETLKGYDDGHIPGAVTLGGDCAKVLRTKEASTVFTDTNIYEKMLGDAGISGRKTVVIYGDKARITNATVGFWIMEWLGVKDVRFLNGGIEAWMAEGKELETKENKLKKVEFKADPKTMKKRIATTEEVQKIAKGEIKDATLLDSRTKAEYEGTEVRAKRGGRIRMCRLNVSHTELYDKATGKIKTMDEVEPLLGNLPKEKRTIPYCQTGTRSTLTYLVLRLMGFKDPANYDESWSIWAEKEELPIEK